jgi:hypothetical protein
VKVEYFQAFAPRWRWFAIGLLPLALAGCATLLPSGEKVVEQKAAARWNAIVSGDLKSAYELISPAGRSALRYEAYEKSIRRGFHKGARVREVRCPTAELCEVTIEVEYEFAGRRTNSLLWEKWVRQDHDWWYLLQ